MWETILKSWIGSEINRELASDVATPNGIDVATVSAEVFAVVEEPDSK